MTSVSPKKSKRCSVFNEGCAVSRFLYLMGMQGEVSSILRGNTLSFHLFRGVYCR